MKIESSFVEKQLILHQQNIKKIQSKRRGTPANQVSPFFFFFLRPCVLQHRILCTTQSSDTLDNPSNRDSIQATPLSRRYINSPSPSGGSTRSTSTTNRSPDLYFGTRSAVSKRSPIRFAETFFRKANPSPPKKYDHSQYNIGQKAMQSQPVNIKTKPSCSPSIPSQQIVRFAPVIKPHSAVEQP